MADKKQLKMLLEEGVEVWNRWRVKNKNVEVDLFGADLTNANLYNANLSKANLVYADLSYSDLSEANFTESNLSYADLSNTHMFYAGLARATLSGANLFNAGVADADFNNANLSETNLSEADMRGADFSRASFYQARLFDTDLSDAYLFSAKLSNTYFSNTKLHNADFSGAYLYFSNFQNIDLTECLNLEKVTHQGPSTLGHLTLAKSRGKLPEEFLKGCGLSDWEVKTIHLYNPDLSSRQVDKILEEVKDIRNNYPIQIRPLFISYSHKDSLFVDQLDRFLKEKNLRFWRYSQDAIAGKLEKQLNYEINDRVMILVLSETSVKSGWVRYEVNRAKNIEDKTGRDVICPILINGTWPELKKICTWPSRIKEQIEEYNILDFSNWRNPIDFKDKFGRLLKGLDLFYN